MTTKMLERKQLSKEDANRMALTLKGLADPTRLQILGILLQGEACVNDLVKSCDNSQSAISHQLRLLRTLRFVSTRREGQQAFYRIDDDHIEELFMKTLEHSRHLYGGEEQSS